MYILGCSLLAVFSQTKPKRGHLDHDYYSEVPNRRADRNKQAGLEESATLFAYLLSKLLNEQRRIFRLLHEKLQVGWKENLKNLSEHALLHIKDFRVGQLLNGGMQEKGCVSQTFELSDEDFSATYESFCQRVR